MIARRFTLPGLLLYISFVISCGRAQCASSYSASIPYSYDIKNVWCAPGASKVMAPMNPCPGVQIEPKGFSLPTVCSTVNQNGYTQVCPTPRGIHNSITQPNAIAINEASGNCYSNIKTPVVPLNEMSQETRIAMKKSPGNYMYPDIPKPFKATIHACLAGYDGEIFQIINEIKKTTGTEIEVHFYLFHLCKFNHLGSHLTNVKCLQEVLAKYHHYICLNKKYVETYSEKEHCWYIEKLIMIPAFHKEVDLLDKNIPIQDFTKICDVTNKKTGFEPLVLEIDEKVGDKKDIQKIKETENKYEICIDHIQDICDNKIGVNKEIGTKNSQGNLKSSIPYDILDASLEKNQVIRPVNLQGNFVAQTSAVTTDQRQNICKNVNLQQNGYVTARKQTQQNIGYDIKYGFPQPAQGFKNYVYVNKPYTFVEDRSNTPTSCSNGAVCNAPYGNFQNGQVQKANLWYKNVPKTNVEMPVGYNVVNNNNNYKRIFPCYNNNVFSSYINNQNNIPASNICKYKTKNPTNIVDKLTSDCVKIGGIIPNLIPLKVNRICQTMNNVITSPIDNAIRNMPCGLIVPETSNMKSVSSENNKNLNCLLCSKPCSNVCQWVNYGSSNTQTQNTGQFKYNTIIPKAALQTNIPTVCSTHSQPCMINQNQGYSTVVPYSPIVKLVTPLYDSPVSYMQPCVASQRSQNSVNQAYITSYTPTKTSVPVCGPISSSTQKKAWPVPESVTVCYTQPAKIPICASSLFHTQTQKNIWPLQYSGAANVCQAQSSKSVVPEFVCASPPVSESISPQRNLKQVCDSNSFYTQRQNNRQSGYQQTFITPQRICLSPGIWQKQGYGTTVPYDQPTYTPSTKAVLPTVCAEPVVPVCAKPNSGSTTTYVELQKNTKANYNRAQEYNTRGSGYSLLDNRALAVSKKQEYGKIYVSGKPQEGINGQNKIYSYTQTQNNLGSKFWTSLSQRPAKICASSNVGVPPRYNAISAYTEPMKSTMQSQIYYTPTQKSMSPQKLDYDIIGSYIQPQSIQTQVRSIVPLVRLEKGISPQTGVKNEYISIDSQTPKSQKPEYGSVVSYTPTQIGIKPNYDMIPGYTPRPTFVQSVYIPLESKQKTTPSNYESISVQMPGKSLNIVDDTATFSPRSEIYEKGSYVPSKNLYPLSQVKYPEIPIGQYTGTLGLENIKMISAPKKAVWPSYQKVPLYTSSKNGPNEETYTMSDYKPAQKRKQLEIEKARNNVIDSYTKNEGQVYELVQSNIPLQAEQFAPEASSSIDNATTKKPALDVISSYAPWQGKVTQDVVDSFTPSQDSFKNNYDKVPIGTSVRPVQPTHTLVSHAPSKGYNGIPPEVRNTHNIISSYSQPQKRITSEYVSLLPCDQKRTLKLGLRDSKQGKVSRVTPEIGSAYDTISSYTQLPRKITPDYVSLLPCDLKLSAIQNLRDPLQGSVSSIPPEIDSANDAISSYTQPQRKITPDSLSYQPYDGSKPGPKGPTQGIVSGIPPEIGSAYDTVSSYTQPQRKITPDYVSLKPWDQKLTSKSGLRDTAQSSVSSIPPEIGRAYDTISSYTQPQRRITPNYVSLLPCDQKLNLKPVLKDPAQYSVSGISPRIGSAYDTIPSYTQPQTKITPDYISLLPWDQKLTSKPGFIVPTQDSISGIPPDIGNAYDTISSYTQPQRRITPNYVSFLPCDQKLNLKPVLKDPAQYSVYGTPSEIGSTYHTISSYTQPQRRITPDYVSLFPCDQKLYLKPVISDHSQGGVSGKPSEIGSAYDTISSYTQPQRKITPDYVPLLPCDQKFTSKPGFIVPTKDSVSGIPPEIGSTYNTITSYNQPQRRITPNYVSLLPCDQKLNLKPDLRDPTQDSVSGIPSEIGSTYDTISSYTQPQKRITPNYVSLLPSDQKLTSKSSIRDPTQDSISGIQPEMGSSYNTISSYTQPQRRITPEYISLLPCDQKLSSIQGLRNPTLDSVPRIPPEIGSTYDTISSYIQPYTKITPDYLSYRPCEGSKPVLKVPTQDSVSGIPSEIGRAYDTISSYTQSQRKTPDYVSLLPCDQKSSIQDLRDPTQDSVSGIPSEIGSAYDTISSYTEPQRRIIPDYVSLLPDQKRNWIPSLRDPRQDRVSKIPPEIGKAYDTISSYTQPQRRLTPDYVSLLPCKQKLTSKSSLRNPSQGTVSGIQPDIGSAYDTISSYIQPQRRTTPDYVSLSPCDQNLTSKPGLREDSVSRIPPEIGSAYDTISSYTQPQRSITPDYLSYRPYDGSKPGLKGPTQGIVSGKPPKIGSAYDTISSYTQPQRAIMPNYVSLLPCNQKLTSKPSLRDPTQDSVSGILPESGSAYDTILSYTKPIINVTPDYVSVLPCDQKLISKSDLRVPTQHSVSGIPPEIGRAYDTISSYTQPQRNIPPGHDSSLPCDDFSSSRPQYDSRSRNAEDQNEKIPTYTKYPSRLSRIDPLLYNGQPGVKPDGKDNEEFDSINSYTEEPKSIKPDLNVPYTPSMSALENIDTIPSYTQQPRSFKQIYDKIAPHLQYPKTTITGYEPLLNYAQPSVTPQRKEIYDFIPSYTSQPQRMTPDNEKIVSLTKPCVIPKVTRPGTIGYDSIVSYIQPQKSIQVEYGNPKITSPEFVSYTQPCPIPKDVQQNYDSMKSYSQYPKSCKQAYDSVSSFTQRAKQRFATQPSATNEANLDNISSYTQYPKTMELEYSQPVVTAKDYDSISRDIQAPIENYDIVTSYAQTPRSVRPTHQSVSSYSRPCLTPKKSTQQKMYDQIAAYTKDNKQKEDYPYSQYPKNVPRYEPTVFEEPCAAPVKENYNRIDSYTETPKIQDQKYDKIDKPGYETVPSYTQPFKQKSKPIYNTIQRYTQPAPSNLQQQVFMQNPNIRRPGYIPVSYIKPNVCTGKRIRPICNKISFYTPTARRVRPRYESIQYTQPNLSPKEASQPYDSISYYNQVPNVPYPEQLKLQYQPILSYTRPCVPVKKEMFVIPRYQSIPTYTKQTVQPKPRYDHIQSYTQPRVPTQPVYLSNQPYNYQSIPSYTKQILPLKAYDHIQSYSQPSIPTQPIYTAKTHGAYETIPSYTESIAPMKPSHDNIQSYTQPGVSTEPLYPSKQPCTLPYAPEVVTSYKTMSQKPIYDNIQSYAQPSLPIQPIYPIRQPMPGVQRGPCVPDIINSYETLANNVYVTPDNNYGEHDSIKAYEPQRDTKQRYSTDPAQTSRTTAPISEPILQYTRPTPAAFNNKNYNTIGSYTQPQKNINNKSDQIMSYTRPQQGEQISVSPQTSSSQYYDTIGSYTQAPIGINDIGNQVREYVRPQIEKQTYVTYNRGNIQDNDIIASYTQPPKSMKDIRDQIMSHSKPQTENPTYLTPSITNNQNPYNQQKENIKDICDQIKSYIEPTESQEQYAPIIKYSQTINDGKQLSDTISGYEETLKNAERVCDKIESYKNIKANAVEKHDNDQIYSFAQPWQRVNNQIPNMKPQAKDLYDQISAYTQPPKNLNPISDYINAPQSPNQEYEPTLSYIQPQKKATENYNTISLNAQPRERVVAPCVPLQKIPQPIMDSINSYTQPTKNGQVPCIPLKETVRAPCMLQQESLSRPYDTISDYTRIPKGKQQVVLPYVPLQVKPQEIYDNIPSYTLPDTETYTLPKSFKQTYDTIPAYTNIPKDVQGIVPSVPPQESPKEIYVTKDSLPLISENVYTPPPESYRSTQSVDAPITPPQRNRGQVFEAINSYTKPRHSEQMIVPCQENRQVRFPCLSQICDPCTSPLVSKQQVHIPYKSSQMPGELEYMPCIQTRKPAPSVDLPWLPQKSTQKVCVPWTLPEQRGRKIYAPCVSEEKLEPSICVPYTMPQQSRKQVCVPYTTLENGGEDTVPCVLELKPSQPICVSYQKPHNSYKQIYDTIPAYTHAPKIPERLPSYKPAPQICKPCFPQQTQQVCVPCMPPEEIVEEIRSPYQKPQTSFKQAYDTIPAYTKPPMREQVCLPCIPQQNSKSPECVPCILQKPSGQVCMPCIPQPNSGQVCSPCIPLAVSELPGKTFKQIYDTIAAYKQLPKDRPQMRLPYAQEFGGQVYEPYVYQKPCQQVRVPCAPTYKPSSQICVPCTPENIGQKVCVPCQLPQKSFKEVNDAITAYTQPREIGRVYEPCIPLEKSRQVYEPCISGLPISVPCIPQKSGPKVCVSCVPQVNKQQIYAPYQPPRKTIKLYDAITAYTQKPEIGRVFEPCMPRQKLEQVYVPCIPQKNGQPICVPCVPQVDREQIYEPCQPPQRSFKEVYDAITTYTQKPEIGHVFEPCMPQGSGSKVCLPCMPCLPCKGMFDYKQQVCVPCVPQLGSVEEICVPCIKTQKPRQQICVPCVPQANGQQVCMPCIPQTVKPKICIPCIPQDSRQQVCVPCIPQDNRRQVCVPCIPQESGQRVCVPCIAQSNRHKVCAPCQPPQKSFKDVYDAITAYTQTPEIRRAFEPCIPQDNSQQVCVPCVPQLGSVEEICVPCIPNQKSSQQICVPCVPRVNGQQICMPCIGRQTECIPCVPQDNSRQVCVPCVPQDNRQKMRVPCLPPQKSFKDVYNAISAYTQPPENGRVCEPCIPTPNSGRQVCTPCAPQLGSVEEICVPCIPTQKPRQQICVPCIPQVSGKQVCWPCASERSGLVCVPCIPQDNRQGVCVPCIPQVNRQGECVPCIPQDNRQGVCVPCIPQDNRQGVCVPCIPQDNRQGVCVPCIPQDNRQGVCVPCIPQDNRQGVCVPCIPQDNRQGICVPCIPQDNRQGVCVPCIPQNNRQGVCVPCIPQDNRQGVCVPCIPQDNRQGVCVPCIPQDNRQGLCVPCIPQDKRQGVCVPCIPQDNIQGVCVPCIPQTNRQQVCVPYIPRNYKQQVCVPCIPQKSGQRVCLPCIPQDSGSRVCVPCMPQDNTQVCTPCLPWQGDNQQISDTAPAYTEPQKIFTQIQSPYLPSTQERYPYFPQNPYDTPNSREGFDTKPTKGQQDTNYQKPNDESATAPKSLIDCLKECITKYVSSNPNIKNDLYNNVGIGDLNNITLDNLAVLTNFENKTAFMTKNIGSNIQLKGFMNKVKIIRPKLVLETQEIEVPNFIPVVTSNENRCQCVIQGLAKAVVETAYSQPVLIRKPSSMDNGYMMVKDKGVSSSNAIIWPAVYQDNAWYKESKDCVCH